MSADEHFCHSNPRGPILFFVFFLFYCWLRGEAAARGSPAAFPDFSKLWCVQHCWTEIRLDCSGAMFPTTKIFSDVFTVWKCPDKTAAVHGNLLGCSRFFSQRCFLNISLLSWQQCGNKMLPQCQHRRKHFRLELVNTDVQDCWTEIRLRCSECIFFFFFTNN